VNKYLHRPGPPPKDGCKDGKIVYPDGRIYRGPLNKDDGANGLGMMTYPDGSQVKGQYSMGDPVDGKALTVGQSVYEGKLN